MIKPASSLRLTLYIAIFAVMFLPYKFIQAVAISIILIIGLSYLWASQLDKHLRVERAIKEIKTVSFERLTISFTIKNKSRFPALLCYVLASPKGDHWIQCLERFLWVGRSQEFVYYL